MSFSFLTGSRGYYLALAAGTVVALTTLGFGFFADDYLHFVTVEGHNDLGSPFDVFVFGNGNTEAMRPYIEKGPYPWFMDLEFKGHFFSAAVIVLDGAGLPGIRSLCARIPCPFDSVVYPALPGRHADFTAFIAARHRRAGPAPVCP